MSRSWQQPPKRIPTDVTTCRFQVDMSVCDGYGICAELVPELIKLDDWGYPILSDGAVPVELARHARRAVRFCPKLALSLVPAEAGSATSETAAVAG